MPRGREHQENEEVEWIDHPPSSSTHESNLLHTLYMLFHEATLGKDITSMDIKVLQLFVDECASMMCSLYQSRCLCCGSREHIDFQCMNASDEVI